MRNFSYAEFRRRYCKSGTPLAPRTSTTNPSDCVGPDFSDWLLVPHPDTLDKLEQTKSATKRGRLSAEPALNNRMIEFVSSPILCCPEDVRCQHNCPEVSQFCVDCRMPMCKSCMLLLQDRQTVPAALANDNWYGYLQRWILAVGVTWMRKL